MVGSSLSTVLLTCLALLASQVCALNINVTFTSGSKQTILVPANQFLLVSDSSLQTNCQTPCQQANNTINGCADDVCLCSTNTVAEVTACGQCYYEQIIKENRPIPGGDPRAGGQTAYASYGTACQKARPNITAAETAFHVPTNWDGPFGQGLNTGSTAVVLAAALTLGVGCIGTLIFM